MNINLLINIIYIISALFFIAGLKMMTSPSTARTGNMISASGMLIAILITLLDQGIIDYEWILLGIFIGSIIGLFASKMVQMTEIPEMVAIFNGFGGIASLMVAWAALYPELTDFNIRNGHLVGSSNTMLMAIIVLSILIGGITFSGSLVAYGKLSEKIPGNAYLIPGQRIISSCIVITLLFVSYRFIFGNATNSNDFIAVIVLALMLGIILVIPIGGADMPVVISLLNSCSGLAACSVGFVLNNNLLIVAGSLVGASGLILTKIMCKAMNRSLINVLFSSFGATSQHTRKIEGKVKQVSIEETYLMLEAASSVVIVPGYGMAVAQAQHVVQELAVLLETNDCEVNFAIHPVAGRMPGHMNVLLSEGNVSYDKLVEMDDINRQMSSIDIAIVIGANDIVNPAANNDKSSPIYGMPIIKVYEAGVVIILKRSMASGFSGVENGLFYGENTQMLFGDAKKSIMDLVSEFKS